MPLRRGESPEALEGPGQAAWWLDDAGTTFDREHAYRLDAETGDRRGVALIATAIAWDYETFRGEALAQSIEPYRRDGGGYYLENGFRLVLAGV